MLPSVSRHAARAARAARGARLVAATPRARLSGEPEKKRPTFAEMRETAAAAAKEAEAAAAASKEAEAEADKAAQEEAPRKTETFEEFRARRLAEREARQAEREAMRKSLAERAAADPSAEGAKAEDGKQDARARGAARGAEDGGLLGRLSAAALGGAALDWMYGEARAYADRYFGDKAAASGDTVPEAVLPAGADAVPRPQVTAEIEALLRPASGEGGCQLSFVTGEAGAGKTTALLRAAGEDKAGVVYVEVPAGGRGGDLAAALSQATRVGVDAAAGPGLIGALRARAMGREVPAASALARTLAGTAALGDRHAAKHGRPATLVVDAADRLAASDPEALAALLDFAGEAAARGRLNVVVVGTEAYAAHAARGAPAAPLCEVGAIGDDRAADLVTAFGVRFDVAQRAAEEVIGGNVARAAAVGATLRAGATVDQVAARALADARLACRGLSAEGRTAALTALVAGEDGYAGAVAGAGAVLYRSPTTGLARFRSPAARAAVEAELASSQK